MAFRVAEEAPLEVGGRAIGELVGGRGSMSWVYNYYKPTQDEKMLQCMLCPAGSRPISMVSGNLNGAVKHLRSQHHILPPGEEV